VRNSLLVEGPCADNERDLSTVPKQRVGSNASGRRALQQPVKGHGQRALEVLQVIMPERVTLNQVRILVAESLRFPGEGKSAQG
jgi:hypothetical protein